MILASLPALVDATQEPFAISSFIPLFHLAQLARNEVAILVSGDGSDELFGGYSDHYRRERRISQFRTFEPFLSALTRHLSAWNLGHLLCRLQRVVALSRLGESMRYVECEAVFTSFQKVILVQPDVLAKCSASLEELLESQCELAISDALEYRRRYDLGIPLVGEMLTKVERATSAAGLECRVPFLDQNLVDYACSIPSNMIIQSHNMKVLLKDVAKGLVPDCVIRRRKHGFHVPLERWISQGDNIVKQILRQPHAGFDSIIRPDVVEAGLRANEQGVGSHANQLWTIAVLKYWFMNNSFVLD